VTAGHCVHCPAVTVHAFVSFLQSIFFESKLVMTKKKQKRVTNTVTHEEPELHPPDLLARVRMADKQFETWHEKYKFTSDPFGLAEQRRDFLRTELGVPEETLKQLIHVAGALGACGYRFVVVGAETLEEDPKSQAEEDRG
jgi:hypothetical protein